MLSHTYSNATLPLLIPYNELCKSRFPTTWSQVHSPDLGSPQGLMNFNHALIPRMSRKSEPVFVNVVWNGISSPRTEGTMGSCNQELDQRLYKMYILYQVRVLVVSAHGWTSLYKEKYWVFFRNDRMTCIYKSDCRVLCGYCAWLEYCHKHERKHIKPGW